MSVILDSERRSWKTKIFLAVVYCALALGAVTMIYPFAVMISGSLSSPYDYNRHSPCVVGFFSESDRFMRSIASHFDSFPRDIYPYAPAHWTTWASVAEDSEGVKAFAQKALSPYRKPEYAAAAKERANVFLRSLATFDPRSLRCKYDSRDVPRFVSKLYGSIDALNAKWAVPHKSFFDISFYAESRLSPKRTPDDPEKFAAFVALMRNYITTAIESGDHISRTLPADTTKYADEIRNALAIEFIDHGTRNFLLDAVSNYRTVADYLFIRGRAFWNTIILVILSVLASLTVNPLAAYALSRFHLRSTEKILLMLLATMAFPAAVTAIPGFLLIRDLGLLNTFAALVLPTVASGMSIFILKGFFDALPRELYEAAAMDGAGEWTIFRKITLPMTTPILAVNALNAFIHAYASWEWAFLVCHRESHWTLAVWLYQMASETFIGQPWCVMAGFVMVSIPTAVVFLFCQKIIMRGIVLPSMK